MCCWMVLLLLVCMRNATWSVSCEFYADVCASSVDLDTRHTLRRKLSAMSGVLI